LREDVFCEEVNMGASAVREWEIGGL
jgi:DNA-binding transcriptional regulator YiaG